MAFIVARLGSTRLPRKALLPILGRPMIERMVERVRKARLLDDVAIATTTLEEDLELVRLAESIGCGHFRGSPDNVSLRMAEAASQCGADVVVELLADNPLVHADLIDDVIRTFRSRGSDYAASVTNEYAHLSASIPRFPIGIRVQVYSREAAECWSDYPEYLERGLGTTAFMFDKADRFKCDYVEARGAWRDLHHPDYHLAVNYRQNFELIESVFKDLYPQDGNFDLQAVMNWIGKHPDSLKLMGNPS